MYCLLREEVGVESFLAGVWQLGLVIHFIYDYVIIDTAETAGVTSLKINSAHQLLSFI